MAGRCKSQPIETRVDNTRFQRLKLKCDKLLSSFAFNLNLRPYAVALLHRTVGVMTADASHALGQGLMDSARHVIGCCSYG